MNMNGSTAAVLEPGVFSYLLGAFLVLSAYLITSAYLNDPLCQYPGPSLAKFTNLWRIYHIRKGGFQHVMTRLHKQYGPVVRIAPNVLDVDDPAMIKTVFNTKGDWKKSDYYKSSSAFLDGRVVHHIFSTDDERQHMMEKRPIAKFYSPTGVLAIEPQVDKTILQFLDELDRRFAVEGAEGFGKPFDLGEWVSYYTWDAVGATTFSQPFGYLRLGRDFDGTILNSNRTLDYFAWVGCIPFLDILLDKNYLAQFVWNTLGKGGFGALGQTVIRHLASRSQSQSLSGSPDMDRDKEKPNPVEEEEETKKKEIDYLSLFLAAQHADPSTITPTLLVSYVSINMGAAADTTAITIRSALYFSLRTPGVWKRLQSELSSSVSVPVPVPFKTARGIPYLEAIVRESLRCLPGVSLGLERIVPPSSLSSSSGSGSESGYGISIPSTNTNVKSGTILAFNPYILCRNKSIWGEDSEQFRPERWLRGENESLEEYTARLQAMNNTDLSFGAGSRVCVGKHLGLLQVYKVVATLALCYDLDLADKNKEWKVINSWFPRQEGLVVKMARRKLISI